MECEHGGVGLQLATRQESVCRADCLATLLELPVAFNRRLQTHIQYTDFAFLHSDGLEIYRNTAANEIVLKAAILGRETLLHLKIQWYPGQYSGLSLSRVQ